MTNLEYLEKIKKADKEHLNDNSITTKEIVADVYYEEYRKIKALEIIAEETINTKIDILEELKNIKIELSVIANKRGF